MAGNALNPKGREIPRGVLYGDTTNDADRLREFEVTVPELFRLVKRSTGRSIFLRAGWFAKSIDQHGVEPGRARGWDITGNVKVPKHVALHFLEMAYTERARAAVWAKITFSNNCLFIGG